MEQRNYHWVEFRGISYFGILPQFVDTFRFLLKSDKNNTFFHLCHWYLCLRHFVLFEVRTETWENNDLNALRFTRTGQEIGHLAVYEIGAGNTVSTPPLREKYKTHLYLDADEMSTRNAAERERPEKELTIQTRKIKESIDCGWTALKIFRNNRNSRSNREDNRPNAQEVWRPADIF